MKLKIEKLKPSNKTIKTTKTGKNTWNKESKDQRKDII